MKKKKKKTWTVRTQRKKMDRKEILFYFKIIKENKKWHGFF